MKKRKYVIFILLFTIILASLTGCGSKKERVVIYSSAEEERNTEMKKQLDEKFPNLDIDVQYLPTGNNAAKIKTEGKNCEADIILGLELAHVKNLEDNFADLSEFDTSQYIDGINPDNHKYVIWEKYTASIIIDKSYFESNNLDIPKTYNDLLDDKYKGLIAMPDPKTSGTGYMYYLNVINEMGEDNALKYFDELSNNIKQFTTSGSGPINLLKQGEIAIAMGMTYQGVEEINKGANYELIELDTGTPYNYTATTIMDGKETRQSVKDVFNFIITDWLKYDREYFVPGKVLKVQDNKINNYPTNLKDANMKNIDSISKKEELVSKWKY